MAEKKQVFNTENFVKGQKRGRMPRETAVEKYQAYITKHNFGAIPDRGFCIGTPSALRRAGWLYDSCFLNKAQARTAAKLLAKASGETVDLVQVQNRGHDRFIVGQITDD